MAPSADSRASSGNGTSSQIATSQLSELSLFRSAHSDIIAVATCGSMRWRTAPCFRSHHLRAVISQA